MSYVLLIGLLVLIDQATKHLTIKYVIPINEIPVIDGILNLVYVENSGAAFGIFQNGRAFFIIITVCILIGITVVSYKYKFKSRTLKMGISLIYAGALGNFIDRITKGYVVDMFSIEFIKFPVFNFADCCVVIGAVLFCIYVFFVRDFFEKESSEL